MFHSGIGLKYIAVISVLKVYVRMLVMCHKVMEWLVNKKQKDILLGLHQHLNTVTPSGGADRTGKVLRVTPHTIDKQVASFKGHSEAIFQSNGILQVCYKTC